MGGFFAIGVGLSYIALILFAHRLNVYRLRRASQGFASLDWLDWDTLLEGLLPFPQPGLGAQPVGAPRHGGPWPAVLCRAPEEEARGRFDLVCALVRGHDVDPEQFEPAGFSGGQARWLKTLAYLNREPERALHRLERADLGTPAELYLREWLELTQNLTPLNLELAVFATKRRLTLGMRRWPQHPALFFLRARASAALGFNQAAIDDLARAVYFGRQSRFHLEAVLAATFIEDARPELWLQCRRIRAQQVESGAEVG